MHLNRLSLWTASPTHRIPKGEQYFDKPEEEEETVNVLLFNEPTQHFTDSVWDSCQMSIEMKWLNRLVAILAKVSDCTILAVRCLLNV